MLKEKTMADQSYIKKVQAMTDAELNEELYKVRNMQAQGYDRLKGNDPFNLLVEASVKMCDDAIKVIKEEQKKRRKRLCKYSS